MRICMLARSLPVHTKGGMEDHIFTLCRGLASAGHDVHVITARRNNKTHERINGVDLHYIDADWRRYGKRYWNNARQKFSELDAKEKFDLIHSQSSAGYGMINTRTPMIVSFHGTSIDEIKTAFNTYGFSAKTLVLAAYHYYFFVTRGKRLAKHAAAVIATSNEQHKIIERNYGVEKRRIFDVYNGIDADIFSPGKKRNGKTILAVARLIKEKGVQYAIEALADIKDANLVVVGDGPYRKQLEDMAKKLGVTKRVKFTGYVEMGKLPGYFNSCDVFVNATVRQNGYDLTILEAMSCEKPVVVSNIGSVPTAVSEREGYLVRPGDVRDISGKLKAVFRDYPAARRKAKLAREKILKKFTSDIMVKNTIKVYKEVINRTKI